MHARAIAVAPIFALACILCCTTAQADSFPSEKIRIVVPTAAAGVADSLARIIGAKVQDNIGQTVYVEDRPGANGNVGAQVALSAPADGYTIMMGHIGLMTINSHLYPKMTFNPVKAFVPIVQVVSYPDVLVVNNDVPVQTFKDFIKRNGTLLDLTNSRIQLDLLRDLEGSGYEYYRTFSDFSDPRSSH